MLDISSKRPPLIDSLVVVAIIFSSYFSIDEK